MIPDVPGIPELIALQTPDAWMIEAMLSAWLLLIIPSRASEMFLFVIAWSVTTIAAMVGCYLFVLYAFRSFF